MYHDHHFHPFGYAAVVNGLDLMAAVDIDDMLRMVVARAGATDGPIIGQRLNDESLSERRLPTAAEIDDVVTDRPVLLYRYCGHVAIANSMAMSLAGVDAGTPDPRGGSIDRDPAGRPTGVMRETAVRMVSTALAPLTAAPSDREVVSALAGLLEVGLGSITAIVSAEDPVWAGVGNEVESLVRIAPDLPISMEVLVIAKTPQSLTAAKARLDEAEGPVRFLGWKEFADGSLGGHTAALYEPYADRTDTRGTNRLVSDRALPKARASLGLGGVVAVHAIGDRANDDVIDLFELLIGEGADPSVLRIEHASLLTKDAVDRIARLGVTASVQPAFLASEASWLEKRIGPQRMRAAYPFRSLLEAGVPVLGGSDTPVETPDPAIGIRAAVERHGINTAEALTEDQARGLFEPHH